MEVVSLIVLLRYHPNLACAFSVLIHSQSYLFAFFGFDIPKCSFPFLKMFLFIYKTEYNVVLVCVKSK